LESLFFDPDREQLAILASGDGTILPRVKKHSSVTCTPVSLACPFSSNVCFVTKVTKDTLDEKGQARDTGVHVTPVARLNLLLEKVSDSSNFS